MVSMEGGIHGLTPYRGSAAISKEKPGVYITEWVQLRRLCKSGSVVGAGARIAKFGSYEAALDYTFVNQPQRGARVERKDIRIFLSDDVDAFARSSSTD